MVGYVYVDPPALDAASVAGWLRLAIPHVLALPPRKRRRPARKAKAKAKSAAKPRPATKAKRTRARRAK
jgi:hypothetical protein